MLSETENQTSNLPRPSIHDFKHAIPVDNSVNTGSPLVERQLKPEYGMLAEKVHKILSEILGDLSPTTITAGVSMTLRLYPLNPDHSNLKEVLNMCLYYTWGYHFNDYKSFSKEFESPEVETEAERTQRELHEDLERRELVKLIKTYVPHLHKLSDFQIAN